MLTLGCSRGNLPGHNGTGGDSGTGTAAGGRGGTVVSGGDAGTIRSAGAGGTVGGSGTGKTAGGAGGFSGTGGTGGTFTPSVQVLPGCVSALMASCVQPSGCGYAPVDAGPIGSCNPDLARAASTTAQDAMGHWMRTLSVQNADGTLCYSFEKYENISRATGGTGGLGGSGSPGGAGGNDGAGGAAGLPVNFCLGTCAYTWRDASGRVIATGTLMWGPSYASTMTSCQLTDEKASCAPPSMMGDPMRCFVRDDGTASSGAPVVTCASGTCP